MQYVERGDKVVTTKDGLRRSAPKTDASGSVPWRMNYHQASDLLPVNKGSYALNRWRIHDSEPTAGLQDRSARPEAWRIGHTGSSRKNVLF